MRGSGLLGEEQRKPLLRTGSTYVAASKRASYEEEMEEAVKQLKDIPRILPFFIIVVVPMPGVTEGYALLAITLEKFLGRKISILPDQFRKVFSKENQEKEEKIRTISFSVLLQFFLLCAVL